MKKIIYLILILLCTASFAQERQIKGKVTSSDGEALPGAYLIEKGTDNGVISDFNGNYQITVSSSGATLTVSFIGFVGQEISIDDKKRIDFSLEELVRSLDDVVVIGFPGVVGKARKRTESVQSIPESVTAMNSKEIEKLGVNSVATFSNLVPNLKLSETQAVGVNSLIIRGIPQIRNSDAPVAFVIDGVTIPDPGLLNQELFDVALIEVVKGPQGALYGKNAIGGAINIYSKEPTNDFKNKLTLGYGNGNSYDARFISSGALKEDKLFYRVSTQYKNFDGLLNNEFLDKKAGATYYSVNPTGGTSGTPGGFVLDPNPNDGNSIISQDVFGESDMKNLYSNLNFEYIFNKVKLKSITSFNNVDRSTIGDLDFTQDVVLDQGETNDTKSFNQEFRLENIVSDSKIDWSVGGFYQNIERTFFQSDLTFSSTFAVTDYVATFNTFALFGFLDYHLTDKLTASAGLRFDSDEFGLEDFLNNQTDKKKDNVLQPKASLAYQANKDVLFYGNYGRGYRAGGFNPKITPEFNRDFKGEISDNFEIGIKTSWWNNRFIINGAVFYSDFTNRQQFGIDFTDFTVGNFNYNKSKIVGFEFDTKTRVSKYLDILFNYGYVKSTINDGGSTGGPNGNAKDLGAFNGNFTSLVPQNNFNIGLESGLSLGEKTTLDFNINLNSTGKIYWNDANDDTATSDAYQLLDARANLTIDNLKFTLWAKNILDEHYYLEYQDFGIGWRGTPATYGLKVSIEF